MLNVIRAIVFFLLVSISNLTAQEFSMQEKISGYAVRDNKLIFIFDSEVYDIQPQKVVTTGNFRGWSQDMNDGNWKLEQAPNSDKIWILELANEDFENVKPHDAFKFRIDNGRWLDPPSSAENLKGGNLIFMHEFNAPTLKAELQGNNTIWLYSKGMNPSLNPSDYELRRWDGQQVSIASILPNTASKFLLKTKDPLDYKRIHSLKYLPTNLELTCSFDGWFRNMYSDKPLGANISPDGKKTNFRIFAPRQEAIRLYLYNQHDDTKSFETIDMVQDQDGVWEAVVAKNLEGIFYDFTVHSPMEPGSHSFEVDGGHISDPYARANVDAQGKSRVMQKTIPATPLQKGIPKLEDVIAYEVHVQDFTDQLPVGDDLKGTIPAMIKRGLKNKRGEKIGFAQPPFHQTAYQPPDLTTGTLPPLPQHPAFLPGNLQEQ